MDLEGGGGRGSIAMKASMGVEEMIEMLTFECETVSHNFLAVVDFPSSASATSTSAAGVDDAEGDVEFPEFPTASASAADSSSRSPRSPLARRGRGPSLASSDSIDAANFRADDVVAGNEARAGGARADRHAIVIDHAADIADPLNNPGGMLY